MMSQERLENYRNTHVNLGQNQYGISCSMRPYRLSDLLVYNVFGRDSFGFGDNKLKVGTPPHFVGGSCSALIQVAQTCL